MAYAAQMHLSFRGALCWLTFLKLVVLHMHILPVFSANLCLPTSTAKSIVTPRGVWPSHVTLRATNAHNQNPLRSLLSPLANSPLSPVESTPVVRASGKVAFFSPKRRRRPPLQTKRPVGRLQQTLRSLLKPYTQLHLINRLYITLALSLTLATTAGIAVEHFALHAGRTLRALELWRPITAAAYFGNLSLPMLSKLYLLATYGQTLEAAKGSAQQLMFLVSQIAMLSSICAILEVPFFSSALSCAALYVCSRKEPFTRVQTVLGLQVEHWQLPFASILIDVLYAQSLRAALPGALGILTGHIYYFGSEVITLMGGKPIFCAPKRLKEWLDKKQNPLNF